MALDRNGTGTSTGASRDNSAEARGASSNRSEGSRGGDKDRSSSSKSSSSSSSSSSKSSPNSTMSEAAQRSAYSAGRAAAQAMSSGYASKSSDGNLTSKGAGSKLSDRVASINSTLNSYGAKTASGTSRWSSDANTNLTEAEQRAAYGYGQDNAQKLGYVENLRNVVRNGTATAAEKQELSDLTSKMEARTGTNILAGGLLGSMAKGVINTGIDAVKDTYQDRLASGITSGELKLSGSYDDKLGNGGMMDRALKSGLGLLGPVGSIFGEAATQPNQTAQSEMYKLAGVKQGVGETATSNGSGYTAPERLTAGSGDLASTPTYQAYYDPTRFGVTNGTRGA